MTNQLVILSLKKLLHVDGNFSNLGKFLYKILFSRYFTTMVSQLATLLISLPSFYF